MRMVHFVFRIRVAQWLSPLGFGSWIGLGLVLLVLLQPGNSRCANLNVAPMARAQGNDEVYEEEVQKGTELLRRHKYEDALKSFKHANEIRDKKSPDCFFGMAQAYYGLEAYKNVVESCERIIELSGSDNHLQAPAYNLKGLAIQALSQGKDQKKLREAEEAFRQGLVLSADLPILHYNLGFVLMQQNRDPEGLVELKKYVELQPGGSSADTARKMMENPRRAREAYAPEFSFTTSEGEYLALEDLRGKVVLLDFWGTWCPPCVASVPSLRSLYKRYAKEPSLVMISVSSDSEEETWRAFTAKNQMVWHQYLDRDRRVQRAFGVHAFPTYILIDQEGIVRFNSIGMSWDKAVNLEDAMRKQLKMVAKEAAPN